MGDALYVTGSLGAAAAGLVWLRRKVEEAGCATAASIGTLASVVGDAGGASAVGAMAAAAGDAVARAAACSNEALSTTGASDAVKKAVERFLRPQPRMRFGLIAGRTRAATACIDLSDGLADAVRQLARASGTGAVIEAETLPVHPGAAEILPGESKLSGGAGPALPAALKAALSGGEDYELLLAVSRRSLRRFLAVQRLSGVPATRIGTLTAGSDLVLRREGNDEPLPAGFEHFG